MDEYTAEAFVNRDEPVPVLKLPQPTTPSSTNDKHNNIAADAASSDSKSKRERLKETLFSSATSKWKDKVTESTQGSKDYGYSLQDRLFTKLAHSLLTFTLMRKMRWRKLRRLKLTKRSRLLQQVIPEDEVQDMALPPDVRSSKYINRPGFSLPLMANNFRRFNARIGVVFVFQNRLERLFTWRQPSHTLSLLAIATFVCLDPYLLSVLPIAGALFFVMVPAYMARHPPPPTQPSSTSISYSFTGPPLAPAKTIKPAGEMSKDFFRNMRDLQNSMDEFSTIHDTLLRYITPSTNFSNEALSSTIFVFLFLATCVLFMIAHVLPWRLLALIGCWTAVGLGHPNVQQWLLANRDRHLLLHEKHAKSWLDTWISHDVIMDEPPETRQVEIFELQRRRNSEWEGWMFSPSPYDPLSPQRISGDRPKGTRFFEDVAPPKGWAWEDKKWVLDLGSRDWVEQRMVQGVEVEVAGERWVSDLSLSQEVEGKAGTQVKVGPGWEEGNGDAKMGEWRRRRWIRLVRRETVSGVVEVAISSPS